MTIKLQKQNEAEKENIFTRWFSRKYHQAPGSIPVAYVVLPQVL